MLTEHFTKILDHFTEWTIGVHQSTLTGRPSKKSQEDSQPINGHPVVIAYKTLVQPCDWCDGVCSKEKIYKRTIGSKIWQAKCQDCGEKRNILANEIVVDK